MTLKCADLRITRIFYDRLLKVMIEVSVLKVQLRGLHGLQLKGLQLKGLQDAYTDYGLVDDLNAVSVCVLFDVRNLDSASVHSCYSSVRDREDLPFKYQLHPLGKPWSSAVQINIFEVHLRKKVTSELKSFFKRLYL